MGHGGDSSSMAGAKFGKGECAIGKYLKGLTLCQVQKSHQYQSILGSKGLCWLSG